MVEFYPDRIAIFVMLEALEVSYAEVTGHLSQSLMATDSPIATEWQSAKAAATAQSNPSLVEHLRVAGGVRAKRRTQLPDAGYQWSA